jgi:4-alpha-glucanotransferase
LDYAAQFLPHELGGDYARAYADAQAAHAAASAAAVAASSSRRKEPVPDGGDDAACGTDADNGVDNESEEPSPLVVAPWNESDARAAARKAGPPPPESATPALMAEIVAQHLASPAALAIFPVQDLCALDGDYCTSVRPDQELINDPTVKRHYWRYRMRDSLEQLGANTAWTTTLKALVLASGRDTAGHNTPPL